MFKTNAYFDNQVLSIAFKNEEGTATVGVMAPGTYTFSTTTIEYMTVISGEMQVQLPRAQDVHTYKAFETFKIEAHQSFQVTVKSDTSYKCIYII